MRWPTILFWFYVSLGSVACVGYLFLRFVRFCDDWRWSRRRARQPAVPVVARTTAVPPQAITDVEMMGSKDGDMVVLGVVAGDAVVAAVAAGDSGGEGSCGDGAGCGGGCGGSDD